MMLTREEQAMLDGEHGPGVQKAMEIIVALARIYRAERLVPVASVQVAGVSYKNLGDAGIQFLEEWAEQGARVKVPTTLNPAGMDLDDWKEIGFSEEFAGKQLKVIRAFQRMGIMPTCTCTPYLAGNVPKYGDHIAWAESSAVSYANSVIGARTNREGGPSAIASAVTGRTAAFGYHLDENRISEHEVRVTAALDDYSDYGALGYWTGKRLKNMVPYFTGIRTATADQLKQLGASAAASGAIALYHVHGITPEARAKSMLAEDHETLEFGEEEKKSVRGELSGEVDLVVFGCPHASLEELKKIASMVSGRKLKAELWVTTSKPVKALAERAGLKKTIEEAGGRIVADACAVVAPVKSLGFKSIAVNSGKYLWYLTSQGYKVFFGDTEKCVQAAVTGRWEE